MRVSIVKKWTAAVRHTAIHAVLLDEISGCFVQSISLIDAMLYDQLNAMNKTDVKDTLEYFYCIRLNNFARSAVLSGTSFDMPMGNALA